jgi:hypothetical protein
MCDKESQERPATFPFGLPLGTLTVSSPGGVTRSKETRPMENRPLVVAVAFILLFAALAFWRSCSY